MSRYRNRQHNSLRVMTSEQRRQQQADAWRRRMVDNAIKRALKNLFASEKPALEGDFEAEKVAKKSVFGDFSPADLPRNEGQVRPLIEQSPSREYPAS